MIFEKDIIQFYETYYREKYGNMKYKFIPTETAQKTINDFLSFLDKKYKLISLGKTFLSRYFSFQFKRLEGQVFKRFSSKDKAGKIQIYDIIGKKPIQYWESRDTEFDYILQNKLPNISSNTVNIEHNVAEDIEKKRFYNSDRGLLNCIEKTSLFNHRSSICILCDSKNECKSLLLTNFPKIYKYRGYDTTA